MPIPDPTITNPLSRTDRVVFLRPLIMAGNIEVGEYTYYDDSNHPEDFEHVNVVYAFGPEKLIIGRYCALAEGVRFIMSGADHPMLGPSTFPFGTFGGDWAETTMDLVMDAPSRGDTVVGNDVWIGYRALVMPGITIGDGAVVAAGSVVVSDIPPYAIAGGNPAQVIRMRYDEADVDRLLRAAWWDWPVELVTEHARTIMAGTPQELERIAGEHGVLRAP
jgi:virginiamycin A acetyltransferase